MKFCGSSEIICYVTEEPFVEILGLENSRLCSKRGPCACTEAFSQYCVSMCQYLFIGVQRRGEKLAIQTFTVILCIVQVAYHGIPDRAYEVFVNALRDRYLESGLVIPSLQDHNPAGI